MYKKTFVYLEHMLNTFSYVFKDGEEVLLSCVSLLIKRIEIG